MNTAMNTTPESLELLCLERHRYAPELNKLHTFCGLEIPAPQVVDIETAEAIIARMNDERQRAYIDSLEKDINASEGLQIAPELQVHNFASLDDIDSMLDSGLGG